MVQGMGRVVNTPKLKVLNFIKEKVSSAPGIAIGKTLGALATDAAFASFGIPPVPIIKKAIGVVVCAAVCTLTVLVINNFIKNKTESNREDYIYDKCPKWEYLPDGRDS